MESLNLTSNNVFESEKEIDGQVGTLDADTFGNVLDSIIGGGGAATGDFSDRLNMAGTGAEPALISARGGYAVDPLATLGADGAAAPNGATTAPTDGSAPAPQTDANGNVMQFAQAPGGYVMPPYGQQQVQYVAAPGQPGAAGAPASTAAKSADGSAPPASGAPGTATPGATGANGQPSASASQQQQAAYYVQQPMYVDQNGQPIYYQTGPAVNEQGVPMMQPYVQQGGYVQQPYMTADGQGMYMQQQPMRGGYSRYDDINRVYDKYDRNDYDRGYGQQAGGRERRDRYDRYDRYDDRRDRRDRYSRDSGRDREGANPGRDPLVDEFRNTFGKSRQWNLHDLLGHVVAFCQDQHGSRFIQQRLEICNDEEKQLVFEEILLVANPLMTDVFGNYVLQKLFEYGTPDQCEQLGLLLSGQAVNLAMQMYGCRVVQKALEYVNTERLMALVSEFESPPVLLRCVHDSNGNHVIQKCIEIVSRVARGAREQSKEAADHIAGRIQFIIDTFKGRVKELSSHPYGCRVVQRILEHCSDEQKTPILEELRQCCSDLVQDCYGNYVIQFVMQHGWDADRAVLIREVQANLLDFSQHKFASNVVEKCLQYASRRDRDEMIWTIINVTFDINNPVDSKGHCVLESMVRDPYANYVVQKVIDVSDERQRAAILRYVRENIAQLRRYTYGKHIIVRLEKLTNEKF